MSSGYKSQSRAILVKSWSIGGFFRLARHGLVILVDEFSRTIWRRPGDKQHKLSSAISSRPLEYDLDLDANNPERFAALRYGFDLLASLNAINIQWPQAHLFDMSSLSIPSKLFAGIAYFQVLFAAVCGLVFIALIQSYSSKQFPLNQPGIGSLFNLTILISEHVYHLFNLSTCALLFYHRKFLHDFILYKCSLISLPARFQRQQMVRLFVALVVLTLISEPLFALWVFTHDLRLDADKSNYLDAGLVRLIEVVIIVVIVVGSVYSCSLGMQIPIVTTFLITSSAAHLDLLLKRQLNRIDKNFYNHLHPNNPTELDSKSQQLIEDFKCDTLPNDWPAILRTDKLTAVRQLANLSATASTISIPANDRSAKERIGHLISRRSQSSSETNSILFINRNLLKSLTELKGLIQGYEQHFGGLYRSHLLVNLFNVSLWTTATFFDHRNRPDSAQGPISEFTLRVLIRLITFVASLFYLFLKSNALSHQLTKLHGQLSRFNVNLGRVRLNGGATSLSAAANPGSLAPLARRWTALDANELEQIWLLYDQIERMSKFVRFRFSGDTAYDKRCLLLILSQMASLVLISIQLVEMYAQL